MLWSLLWKCETLKLFATSSLSFCRLSAAISPIRVSPTEVDQVDQEWSAVHTITWNQVFRQKLILEKLKSGGVNTIGTCPAFLRSELLLFCGKLLHSLRKRPSPDNIFVLQFFAIISFAMNIFLHTWGKTPRRDFCLWSSSQELPWSRPVLWSLKMIGFFAFSLSWISASKKSRPTRTHLNISFRSSVSSVRHHEVPWWKCDFISEMFQSHAAVF